MGTHKAVAVLLLILVAAGCARSSPIDRSGASAANPAERTPKRITAAIRGDPHTVYQKLNPRSNIPGIDALEELVSVGLTNLDDQANRFPQLAESVPNLLFRGETIDAEDVVIVDLHSGFLAPLVEELAGHGADDLSHPLIVLQHFQVS